MILKEGDYLEHYGILRKSGRYPWGSGGTQSSRNRKFLDTIHELRDKGMKDTEIARGFGMTLNQLRAANSIARNEQRQSLINQVQRRAEKGESNSAIGRHLGINESTVRSLRVPGAKAKADILMTTSNMLKDQVDEKGVIDIGSGVENHIGVSSTRLGTAVAMLQERGYEVHTVKTRQLGTGEMTTHKVLTKPGMTQKDVWKDTSQIKQITDFSEDGGRSFLGLQPPIAISSKRVDVRWDEDGGGKEDGIIYIRPNVKDVSIGASRYAQVRIAIDGTHYLKGMAMYKGDLPKGVDLQFNTSKKKTDNKMDAMKALKDDPDNPFGAVLRQIIGPDGKVSSAMNIVGSKEGMGEEGGWETWTKRLSSQFLSKQSPDLAKNQLAMTAESKRNELDEILSLTNPLVRKKLLESYADDADSSAVHLHAASLPNQASHVILPINSMKPGEVYAPNHHNGDRVALVRYPHAGPFEIPELTVNNRHAGAKKLLGNSKDAIGINHKVAERLSGADFDGDTVLVIRNNKGLVKSSPALEGLKGFDPRSSFPPYEGMKPISPAHKQKEMGRITNLIADMTIRGADNTEKARAVRHSMVVIDSEKHNLDYKSSAKDNGIAQLKAKYQGSSRAGASTLITRASAETRVPDRKPRSAAKGGPIDKATGKKVFEETGITYVNRKGQVVLKTKKSERLAETDDAHTLSSGTPVERLYADHSNRLKALANTARKEAVTTKTIPYSKAAKEVYSTEVASLNAKLNLALKNRPLERSAQVLADAVVKQKRQANPHMDGDDLKKIKFQALAEARNRTGAKKQRIELSQDEWNAIQSGAISNSKLNDILNNSDLDVVKKLATPRTNRVMTSAKQARAEAMLNSGYTQAEVAAALGVALSTLKSSIA